ncbi:MAG: hypothetical protein KatS3mg083_424 [Candidatus Dojkabacteria bacterium]|nr:MAG: hypothetical protein KatS3mg083_424 [Candidatus Dojkabacteria bacterium]
MVNGNEKRQTKVESSGDQVSLQESAPVKGLVNKKFFLYLSLVLVVLWLTIVQIGLYFRDRNGLVGAEDAKMPVDNSASNSKGTSESNPDKDKSVKNIEGVL